MNTLVRAALAVCALLLTTASAAHAASISYVAPDGNVHLVSPDGSRDIPDFDERHGREPVPLAESDRQRQGRRDQVAQQRQRDGLLLQPGRQPDGRLEPARFRTRGPLRAL